MVPYIFIQYFVYTLNDTTEADAIGRTKFSQAAGQPYFDEFSQGSAMPAGHGRMLIDAFQCIDPGDCPAKLSSYPSTD